MSKIELTVLMACRNGGQVLPRVLEGYRRVEPPPVGWKMVIVDNGSTDATFDIINSFSKDLPIELLRLNEPGKNRALNAGIAAVQGRIAVLTDDDAIPHPAFLSAWAKFLDRERDHELLGGSIEPLFDAPPPPWLLKTRLRFALMFSERELPEGPIDAGDIYGPNMAVRTSIFDRGLRFDENMGPNALDPDYPMGSEVEFCRRVASSGASSWFAKEPRVHHIVRAAQFTKAAWAKRAYRCGRGRARLMWQRGEIFATPTPTWSERLTALSPLPQHRFDRLCSASLVAGFRDECAKWLSPTMR
jgi:glycosyltransferase involved in cell wall biosynthesis